MSVHTPEPWTVREREWLIWKRGHVIAELMQFGGEDRREANARRIVACVNACAGLSNDRLEADAPGFLMDAVVAAKHAEIDRLRQQVADLRAALENTTAWLEDLLYEPPCAIDEANRDDVADAIIKANNALGTAGKLRAATQPQEVQP